MKLINFKTTDKYLQEVSALHVCNGLLTEQEVSESPDIYDCEGCHLFPGFFDIQLYGASGHVFDNEPTIECLERISSEHERYGTTAFLITLPSTSPEKILKGIDIVRAAMSSDGINVKGIHLEGPFLNPQKSGAHNIEYIQKPNISIIDEILSYGKGVIKMMTIAPELFTDTLLEKLMAYGVKLSVGHSNATYAETKRAFGFGIDCCTHLYNAMSPMESRAAGVVGACLNHEEVWATLVVDGKHVCYETLALTLKLKPNKLMLISDATFLNVQSQTASLGSIQVYKSEEAFYTKDGKLAGSSIALLHAVKNCTNQLNVPLKIAVDMASTRPAAFLEIDSCGKLKYGQKADLILLDDDGALKGVMVSGQWRKDIASN